MLAPVNYLEDRPELRDSEAAYRELFAN